MHTQSERRNWPFYRRVLAVISNEGLYGGLLRTVRYSKELYHRYIPQEPTETYDESFYAMSRAANTYCVALAEWLSKEFHYSNILDVGCGDCALMLAIHNRGWQTFGIDGSAIAVVNAPKEVLTFYARLDHPFLLNRKFHLVSSIEVAEHLPKRAASGFVTSVVRHAKNAILFSAAHPGQGGIGHINEQPREYWLDLFAAQGWHETLGYTEEIKAILRQAKAPEYLQENIAFLEPPRYET